jgi:acyl-coenzyme A thioesterase PaaI-like protein
MLRNPQGSLHGGAMATAMDISMGHLVNKIAGPGATSDEVLQLMEVVRNQVAERLEIELQGAIQVW